jgi:L-seryl-tRNA(Ser) seleniumtransferase
LAAGAEEQMSDGTMTRRELLRRGGDVGGILALPLILPREAVASASRAAVADNSSGGLRVGNDIYQSIGVRPIINARGTYTIISGSVMLPEVRAALDAAAQHYVHLDELSDAIGARLATLTGAEWGLVTSGCAAALTHATAACVAGGNPDLHVRIPNLTGFPRDEAIIPKHSRNVYDAAIRAVGLRVIEVETFEQLQSAFGPRTAMVYIFAGPNADKSPVSLQAIAPVAKANGVPILVDAAAEVLTVPNVHLQNGATLVAYSGGKCIRGPQTAGLLLGRKDLVRAAWVHSAPHHGFSRGMKVGKEEAVAMLMAVEMWMKRDHDAEWAKWTSWLNVIAARVKTVEGVRTAVVQPEGLSNKTPSLRVLWDRSKLGVSGDLVARMLLDGEPRVAVFAARGETASETGVSITPYMLLPGDAEIVADRLAATLSHPPQKDTDTAPKAPATDLSGHWDVQLEFAAGRSTHGLHLRQRGNDLDGTHAGDFVSRDLTGTIDGNAVRIHSTYDEAHGDALNFTFVGKVAEDSMSGTLDMGEYLMGTWKATRHDARRG